MNFFKKITLAAIAVAGLSTTAWANSLTLGDYLDAAALLIPNTKTITGFAEVGYNSNIKLAPKGREIDSLTLRGGIRLDVARNYGNGIYGIKGSVSYKYFDHKNQDLGGWDVNVTPYILGNIAGIQNLMFRASLVNNRQSLDQTRPRYTRTRTANAGLSYDLAFHERYGIALTGDYTYKYYPQREFKDYNKHVFEFAAAPYYRFSEKLKAGIKVSYDETHYEHNTIHDDSHTLTLNAYGDYRPSSLFSVYGEVGAERRSYEGAARGTGNDDLWKYNSLLRLRWTANKYLTTDYTVKYAQDDTYAARGAQNKFDTNLSVTYAPTAKWSIGQIVGCEVQDEKANNYDTLELYYNAIVSYKFNKNLTAYATYDYHNIQYKYTDSLDYYVNEVIFGISYTY